MKNYIKIALNYFNNSDRLVLLFIGLTLTSLYAPVACTITASISLFHSLSGSVRGTMLGYQQLTNHYVRQFELAYYTDLGRIQDLVNG